MEANFLDPQVSPKEGRTWATRVRGALQSYSATPYSYSLQFTANGLVRSANDSQNGNWTYGYDDFNRLLSSNKNSSQQTFTYEYDRYGNRWHQNAPQGGPAPQLSFTSNNRMDGYSYDAAGNLLNDGAHSYVYDAEGRLVSRDSNATNYVFDAEGRRVARQQTGTTVWEQLFDVANKPVITLDGSGNVTEDEIYLGDGILLAIRGGARISITATGRGRRGWTRVRAVRFRWGVWTCHLEMVGVHRNRFDLDALHRILA